MKRLQPEYATGVVPTIAVVFITVCVCVCVCVHVCVCAHPCVCAEVHPREELAQGGAASLHQRSTVVAGPVPDGLRGGGQFHSLWLRSGLAGGSPWHHHRHWSVVLSFYWLPQVPGQSWLLLG